MRFTHEPRFYLAASLAFLSVTGCGAGEDDPLGSGTGPDGSAGAPTSSAAAGGAGAGMTGGSGAVSTSSGGTTPGSGGSPPTGGTASGGGGAPSSRCSLSADRVRITDVDVGRPVLNNETDAVGAVLHPLMLASLPSGGARLAWMSDDGRAYVATLDEDDQRIGTPNGFLAHSLADLHADESGGVLLVTRDARGDGDAHCGNLDHLCGAESERSWQGQWGCWDMVLVRFDGADETWATQLTDSTESDPPYLAGPTVSGRVVFIWQPFAHHGRIASSGSSYAAYFGASVALSEPCISADSIHATAVNIHQGDRMRVVGLDGQLQDGGFGWGCSHSGYERVVWDAHAGEYVAVCKTDDQDRLAIPSPRQTIRSVDLWYSNMSDLVSASGGGTWLATSDLRPGQPPRSSGLADIHLVRFSTGEQEADLLLASDDGTNHRAPHLAAYGATQMVAAWESAPTTGDFGFNNTERQLYVQALDRATGAPEGAPLPVDVRGNRYHKLVAFPDGSVAFAARGETNTRIRILRILPC
jgi:hypothetical protein